MSTTAWAAAVFAPNPTYGLQIVNVSFAGKTAYGTCLLYTSDAADE